MNIDFRDIIVLDDNQEYFVAKKVICDNIACYCLVNTLDNGNIKLVYENDEMLVDLNDGPLFEQAITLMNRDIEIQDVLSTISNKLKQEVDNQN